MLTTTLARWARRYGADLEAAQVAIAAWLETLHDSLGPDEAAGDTLWLEDQFQAWLEATGRVRPPAPRQRATTPAAAPAGRAVPDADATRRLIAELRP